MRHLMSRIKLKFKKMIKRLLGIEALDRRISRLEENGTKLTNTEITAQIENGLRYINLIRTTHIIHDHENSNKG